MTEKKILEFMNKQGLTKWHKVILVLKDNKEEKEYFFRILEWYPKYIKSIKRLKKWKCRKEWLPNYNVVVELSKKYKNH